LEGNAKGVNGPLRSCQARHADCGAHLARLAVERGGGRLNTIGWGVVSITAGTGEIGADHAIVGVGAAAACAGAVSDEKCAKKPVSVGLAVTNFAFTVMTGFANAMFPAAYTVGEQKAM